MTLDVDAMIDDRYQAWVAIQVIELPEFSRYKMTLDFTKWIIEGWQEEKIKLK